MPPQPDPAPRRIRPARWASLPVVALLTVVGTFGIASPWHVQGRSMEPAIGDQSVVLVDALVPRLTGLHVGDVVVLELPPDVRYPARLFLKRIVGVAGDRIVVDRGRLYRNGEPAPEPYLPPGTVTVVAGGHLDVVVPPGSIFVLGDHRSNSFDSTAFGPVHQQRVIGRAWLAVESDGIHLPGAFAARP